MYINGNFLFLLIFSVYSCFIMLLVSVAQWSESATRMYTYIPPLFGFPLQLGHHRALSRVSLMHGMFYVKVLHNCKSFPIKKFHRSKGVLFFFFSEEESWFWIQKVQPSSWWPWEYGDGDQCQCMRVGRARTAFSRVFKTSKKIFHYKTQRNNGQDTGTLSSVFTELVRQQEAIPLWPKWKGNWKPSREACKQNWWKIPFLEEGGTFRVSGLLFYVPRRLDPG